MTSTLKSHDRVPDPGTADPSPIPRLAFPPSPTAHGVLDGCWWPRTRDPAAELPALVAAVAERLGVVIRIALSENAWDTTPRRIIAAGDRVVLLDWLVTWDQHTIRLIGSNSAHIDLLAIPSETARAVAMNCLAVAAGRRTSPDPPAAPIATRAPATPRLAS
jgi:hypothetical protein